MPTSLPGVEHVKCASNTWSVPYWDLQDISIDHRKKKCRSVETGCTVELGVYNLEDSLTPSKKQRRWVETWPDLHVHYFALVVYFEAANFKDKGDLVIAVPGCCHNYQYFPSFFGRIIDPSKLTRRGAQAETSLWIGWCWVLQSVCEVVQHGLLLRVALRMLAEILKAFCFGEFCLISGLGAPVTPQNIPWLWVCSTQMG